MKATLLAATPDAARRNPKEALQLAEQANRIERELDWDPWAALAAACAELGQFDQAVECQQ